MILQIITPQKIVFKDDVDELIAPTEMGEIGILPNHVPLVAKIVPGELIIQKGGKLSSLAVTEGFLEIKKDEISVLANFAIRAEDIQIAQVEEAKKRAELVAKEKATDRDFKIAEGELLKSLIQLRVATKYRRRRSL